MRDKCSYGTKNTYHNSQPSVNMSVMSFVEWIKHQITVTTALNTKCKDNDMLRQIVKFDAARKYKSVLCIKVKAFGTKHWPRRGLSSQIMPLAHNHGHFRLTLRN